MLFRSMSDENHSIRAAQVYAEELGKKGRGVPLWYPEPSTAGEVQIGDVGILYNGGFHRLFNVRFDETHPWNPQGVPLGHEPLPINEEGKDGWLLDYRPDDIPQGLLSSTSIRRTEVDAFAEA